MPRLREYIDDITEVFLARRRANDGLYGNAKKGQCEEENEDPEDGSKHGGNYTTLLSPANTSSRDF